MSYTKGPWKSDTSAIIRSVHGAPEFGAVAKVYVCTEWKDNADLIAAAPELYEACKAMDEYTHREQEPGPMTNPSGERFEREQIWKMVRAAIQKAEGK